MATRTAEDTRLHLREGSREDTRPPKIVAISVPFPGAKRPLEEGAKLGLWDFVLLRGERVQIPPADVYILGAWHQIYNQLLNLGGRIGVLWTSSGGEMDFEPVEQWYLRDLATDPRISFIWFSDPAYGTGELAGDKAFYAPYPLHVLEELPDIDKVLQAKQDILTLFCPTGHKKCILNQLLAVKIFQQRHPNFVLHTNIQGYDYPLNQINHVRHGWLPEEEYRALIRQSRVGLACSWSETFNYQVAEALLMGTISVISATIPLPGILADPHYPVSIAGAVQEAISLPYSKFGPHGLLQQLRKESERRNAQLRQALERFLLLP